MSRIVDVYKEKSRHPCGVTIETIWGWDERELEYEHTHIQWLLPLREPSRAVPGSPAGGPPNGPANGVIIAPIAEFAKSSNRLTAANHNHPRITRILKSLVLLGLKREALAWFAALQRVYVDNAGLIGRTTHEYWLSAVV